LEKKFNLSITIIKNDSDQNAPLEVLFIEWWVYVKYWEVMMNCMALIINYYDIGLFDWILKRHWAQDLNLKTIILLFWKYCCTLHTGPNPSMISLYIHYSLKSQNHTSLKVFILLPPIAWVMELFSIWRRLPTWHEWLMIKMDSYAKFNEFFIKWLLDHSFDEFFKCCRSMNVMILG